MLTDVQIAQSAKMEPIKEIAAKVGLSEDDLELYGKSKAKISLETIERLKDQKDGKLVLVTAINPTPAGEGKTTTMIGLAQSLNKIGPVPFVGKYQRWGLSPKEDLWKIMKL